MTGLVGPDGAGKTTLMRLMAALLDADLGQASACAASIARRNAAEIHDTIGYMPQRFGLYEDLTVMENLTLYADLRGVVGEARAETFERLLAFTDLDALHRPARRRAVGRHEAEARARLRDAALAASAAARRAERRRRSDLAARIVAHGLRLIDEGVGVVWSTAYLDEAENCAEVIVLNEGRVLFQGDPKAMTAQVAGRVFQLRGAGAERRDVLARALTKPEVIDGVMQGEAVRLVIAEGQGPPPPGSISHAAGSEIVAARRASRTRSSPCSAASRSAR